MNRIFKSIGIESIKEGIVSIAQSSTFNYAISLTGTGATWLFGTWDIPLQVLLTAMGLDYATGLMRAWKNNELNSSVGFEGLMKKCGILVVVTLAVLMDRLIGADAWVFRTAVSLSFFGMEGLSVLENTESMGIVIHPGLAEKFEHLRKGGKKEIDKNKKED